MSKKTVMVEAPAKKPTEDKKSKQDKKELIFIVCEEMIKETVDTST